MTKRQMPFALALLVRKMGKVVHFSGFRPKNELPLLLFCERSEQKILNTFFDMYLDFFEQYKIANPMKNVVILVVTFCFLSANGVRAQNRRSGGQEGGLITVGASLLKFSKTGRRTGLIGGEFGYAHPIGEKNSIGANVYFNTRVDELAGNAKTNIVTFQPEFRNYFSESAFSGAYIAINGEYQNQRTTFGNVNYTTNNFGVGLGAGYNVAFTDRILGSIKAGYDYILNDNQNSGLNLGTPQSTSQWIFGAGIGIRLE
jgi:hypothetical protein